MIWWLLMAAVPVDRIGEPLPLYLTEQSVASVLDGAVEALSVCAGEVTHPVTLSASLRVAGDGSVKDVSVSQKEPSETSGMACWTDGLQALVFPKHGEADAQVRFSMYVRDGELSVSPKVDLAERPIGPMLFFLSPVATESVATQEAARLGRPRQSPEPK